MRKCIPILVLPALLVIAACRTSQPSSPVAAREAEPRRHILLSSGERFDFDTASARLERVSVQWGSGSWGELWAAPPGPQLIIADDPPLPWPEEAPEAALCAEAAGEDPGFRYALGGVFVNERFAVDQEGAIVRTLRFEGLRGGETVWMNFGKVKKHISAPCSTMIRAAEGGIVGLVVAAEDAPEYWIRVRLMPGRRIVSAEER
jgi:hypothetical protein